MVDRTTDETTIDDCCEDGECILDTNIDTPMTKAELVEFLEQFADDDIVAMHKTIQNPEGEGEVFLVIMSFAIEGDQYVAGEPIEEDN